MMGSDGWRRLFLQIVVMGTTVLLVGIVLTDSTPWPTIARDYLEAHGVKDSDASNLVSAIYLGYRAFDTIGETIVLLTAVAGAIALLLYPRRGTQSHPKHSQNPSSLPAFALPDEKRPSHLLRTNLIEEVTGKVAPIVLLFGIYLMLYGHRSPGGGFQGGVVIASGIVFLGLGQRLGASTGLVRVHVLERLEAAATVLLFSAAVCGMVVGSGFLDDPLRGVVSVDAAFIVVLNTIIGLKVGAGISLLCLALLGKTTS